MTDSIRIVHEGRGGHVEIDSACYPLEHVGEGRFAVRCPRRSRHRRALEAFVTARSDRLALEPP